MNLPIMPNASARRELKQYQFGGYDHRRTCSDGGIYDMMNLCGDDYPIVSTRKKNRAYTYHECYSAVEYKGVKYWLAKENGNGVLYKGEDDPLTRIGTFTPNYDNWLVAMDGYIFAYPDGWWYKVGSESEQSGLKTGTLDVTVQSDNVDIVEDDTITVNHIQGVVRIIANGTTVTGENPALYLKQRQGVTIRFHNDLSGSYIEKAAVIQGIDGNSAGVDNFRFPVGSLTDYQGSWAMIEIVLEFPKLKAPFVHESRIWGFTEDAIYASSLKDLGGNIYASDPWNFFIFEGNSSSSWFVEKNESEIFTAGISYNGYPTFFTENSAVIVYGSDATQFSPSTRYFASLYGAKKGNERSVAISNNILYYFSQNGIMAFNGGNPVRVSDEFGDLPVDSVVGGSDGERYYACISSSDDDFDESVMVYQNGMWHRQEWMWVHAFCVIGYRFYALSEYVVCIHDDRATDYDDQGMEWFLESGDFYDPASGASYIPEPGKVTASKIVMRIELSEFEEGEGYCRMLIQYDSSGEWIPVKTIKATPKRTHTFAVVPHRCDHYRLRIEGKGEAHIYEVTRESKIGSTLKSTKGVQ